MRLSKTINLFALAASTTCAAGCLDSGDAVDVESAAQAITAVGDQGFAPSPGDVCDTSIEAHAARHSYIGSPVPGSDQTFFDGGTARDFTGGGTIIMNPRFGCAYLVRWGFWERWKAEGNVWSELGYPVSDEVGDGHGSFQFFERGSLWWTQDRGVRGLYGPIAVKHNEVRGWGGYPLTDAGFISEFGGKKVVLENGHEIYWTATTGAHAVRQGILAHYLSIGAERSTLGFPVTDEICEPGHCHSDFQGGRIDWHDGIGSSVSGTIEDVPVWRLQLEVQVCDSSGAGTDNPVFVEMSSTPGQRYFVDSEHNDFERGNVRRYDVSPSVLGISTVSDITRLTIGKTFFSPTENVWVDGGWKPAERPAQAYDDLCLERVALYVNQAEVTAGAVAQHAPIFNQTFAPRRWLTSKRRAATVFSASLRGFQWSTARVPSVAALANAFTFPELEAIITGITGHTMTNSGAVFGDLHGRAVEVTFADEDLVHVDLDLEVNAFEDPEADVDFDIRFVPVCGENPQDPARLIFQIENVVVDVDSAWWQPLSAIVFAFYTPAFPELSNLNLGAPHCPTVVVSDTVPGRVMFF